MTDAGLSPSEEAHIQQAADQAYRVLTGDEPSHVHQRSRLSDVLCKATRAAPLQALTVAFLLGVLVARRQTASLR